MGKQIKIVKFADLHVHLRRGAVLKAVVMASALQCYYILVMPNAIPGVYNAQEAAEYRMQILDALGGVATNLVMSIYITPKTTEQDIYAAHAAGVRNGKIYPKDLTNQSQDGFEFRHYFEKGPVYAAMQKCGMVLSLHGERPGKHIHALNRERLFLPIAEWIATNYPQLKIVLEHITTAAAVKFVERMGPNVAATITLHHLLISFNDLVEPKLHPHLFCKPLAKLQRDMKALRRAALSGNPKFFLGSDSAPHLRSTKECPDCCAGVYTAEVLAPVLYQFFRENRAEDKLANFASFFGPMFYGLPAPDEMMTLEEAQWQVPLLYPVEGVAEGDGLVSFLAGKILPYRLVQ